MTRAFRDYAEEEGMSLLGTEGKAILNRHDLGEIVLQRDDFRK